MSSSLWTQILAESWLQVKDLAFNQSKCGYEPFRSLGDERWIVAELYHQIKAKMEKNAFQSPEYFISTEIKPLKNKSVDIGIIRFNSEDNSTLSRNIYDSEVW